MTNKDIVQWIRDWFKKHPHCNELDSMYEDFLRLPEVHIENLTKLLWKIDPLKYMTYVPDKMLTGCEDITSVVIPGNITNIGFSAFSYCKNLTSVTISNGVTSIDESAFHRCFNLTNVTIPNSVTSIGKYAFYDGKNLTNITIPVSVTNIGTAAFEHCGHLQITFLGTKQQWKNLVTGKNIFYGTTYVCNCHDGVVKKSR